MLLVLDSTLKTNYQFTGHMTSILSHDPYYCPGWHIWSQSGSHINLGWHALYTCVKILDHAFLGKCRNPVNIISDSIRPPHDLRATELNVELCNFGKSPLIIYVYTFYKCCRGCVSILIVVGWHDVILEGRETHPWFGVYIFCSLICFNVKRNGHFCFPAVLCAYNTVPNKLYYIMQCMLSHSLTCDSCDIRGNACSHVLSPILLW